MSSRYPSIKVIDYCYHPIHVVDNTKDIYVPCGKCDGCLLHKANDWSMRVGQEIEATPYTIFFSLTYSNKFLPKLIKSVPEKDDISPIWYSDNIYNWRFDGKNIVRRKDGIIFQDYNYPYIPVTNSTFRCIPYASKRDIILWLKIVRKNLDLYARKFNIDGESQRFRYFIISEIGPTTMRPHYHGLVFSKSREVSEALISSILFSSWQMCDADRFFPYAHFCDSGARGYVTQYLTCHSDLPKVFVQNKDIRPFRLSSKAPGIGSVEYDQAKIFEDVSSGTIEYSRVIRRLGVKNLLRYPSYFARSLFPKCYRYSELSPERILAIYGYLWRKVVHAREQYSDVIKGLSFAVRAQDLTCMRACFKACNLLNITPETYVWILDRYHYLSAMDALEHFYSDCPFDVRLNFHDYVLQYNNLYDVACKARDGIGNWSKVLDYFLFTCGFDFGTFDKNILTNKDFYKSSSVRDDYKLEVSGIIQNMTKTSKLNEISGNAPTIV